MKIIMRMNVEGFRIMYMNEKKEVNNVIFVRRK